MADDFIIRICRKTSPANGYITYEVVNGRFKTKTDARRYIYRIFKEDRSAIGAEVSPASCVGVNGQYFCGIGDRRWSASEEILDVDRDNGFMVFTKPQKYRNTRIGTRKQVFADGSLEKGKSKSKSTSPMDEVDKAFSQSKRMIR